MVLLIMLLLKSMLWVVCLIERGRLMVKIKVDKILIPTKSPSKFWRKVALKQKHGMKLKHTNRTVPDTFYIDDMLLKILLIFIL